MNDGTRLYDMIENLKHLMEEMHIRQITINHESVYKFNKSTHESEKRHNYAVRIDQDDEMRPIDFYPRCLRERGEE